MSNKIDSLHAVDSEEDHINVPSHSLCRLRCLHYLPRLIDEASPLQPDKHCTLLIPGPHTQANKLPKKIQVDTASLVRKRPIIWKLR